MGQGRVQAQARRVVQALPACAFVALVIGSAWVAFNGLALIDFFSFWHASGLILAGEDAAVYSLQPSPVGQLMPLAYPPPFLFLIAPLALMPFGVAYLVWVVATGALYTAASRAPLRLSLANPPAASCAMVGQNGMLVASIMLFAAHSIRSRPLLGGALFGLMVIKPHFAVLIPVALAAGRHWAAFAAAAASSIILLLAAALIFGLDVYRGFLDVMPQYAVLLEEGRWPWNQLASVFAFFSWFGAGRTVALMAHAAVAIAGAVLVWRAWREDWDSKIAVLAAGSLLISPYVFTYDTVLLIAPIAWLATRRPAMAAVIWGLSALPLVASFGFYSGPNTLPLAILLSLAAVSAPAVRQPARPSPPGPR